MESENLNLQILTMPRRNVEYQKLIDFLDKTMHQIANNQQVVIGKLELLIGGAEGEQSLRKEISRALEAAEKNNKLIFQIKKRISSEMKISGA
jgi:hypothetical protein